MNNLLTVADIVADPGLDTHFICGESGGSRLVSWAHSCEMPDPANWLQAGELLMTIGLCVPKTSEEQRRFVAALDEAGLAGISIGDDGIAPRLTKAMKEEAEKRGFPILETGSRTPFVAISRMVASANSDHHALGLARLAKLYQIAAQRDAEAKRSGVPLGRLFNAQIQVIDDLTGCVVVGEGLVGGEKGRAYPLRTLRDTTLLLEHDGTLDGFAIVHLSQVLAVDVNEILQDALRRSQEGARHLRQALTGRVGAAEAFIGRWGNEDGYRVIATEGRIGERVPLALALAGVRASVAETRGVQVIAVPESNCEQVRTILADLAQIAAASALHHHPGDLAGAIDESISELASARANQEQWRVFEGDRVSLLARSLSEQKQIVDTVLGALAEDGAKAEALRETLFTFLDHNMRWNETAESLNLHRQSVVYRLERVEQLTGRSVRSTKDIAEFYLARTSWKMIESQRRKHQS